jgi:hypothetical protein
MMCDSAKKVNASGNGRWNPKEIHNLAERYCCSGSQHEKAKTHRKGCFRATGNNVPTQKNPIEAEPQKGEGNQGVGAKP